MARIPAAELERLKAEVSLVRLAEARGVRLERRGGDLVGLCPFHDDREPSLVVTPAKNLWHCLGACQAGGTVVDWVMRAEGVSFRHAVELLRRDLPSLAAASSGAPPPRRSTVPKLPSLLDATAEDAQLLQDVVAFYHQTLLKTEEARAYLASRGLGSEAAVRRFQLGFANRTLGYRMPAKNRKEGEAIRGRLTHLGVLRESGHEHLAGSLVIPIFDEDGRVAELYGRKVTRNLRPGTPDHLYLPGPHRGVWNYEALREHDEVILCEALLDALTFWEAGFRNVTAAYGTQGFTKDHREAFRRHGIQRVLLAYDRDAAGEEAAEKLARELQADGIGCYRILFPKGMDANEYALKVQPAAKSLEILIRKATWLGKGSGPAVATRWVAPEEAEQTAAKEQSQEEVADLLPEQVTPESGADSLPLAALVEPAEAQEPRATPEPRAQDAPLPEATVRGDEVELRIGDRRWRVRGLARNKAPDQLRVNLLVARESREPGLALGFHVDTLDLYAAKPRQAFLAQAAEELALEPRVVKRDLGLVLLRLEALQEEQRKQEAPAPEAAPAMSDAERAEALGLLRDPQLLERLLADFDACGVVGEETNKLVGYLAAVSRKLDQPLAVVIQSSSAAGKSSLMEAVLAFVPEEERVQYSAMTGQSLFYLGEEDLRHKVLALVEGEGAERAAYALKLLQSEGELSIASTGKDPETGRLVTHTYHVAGPVALFLTTTAIEIDEELLNRCLVLTVDEGREQTRAIHRLQRERQTLEGLLASRDREHRLRVHRNAQRLLRPLLVANPYARALTFPGHQTRTRRDHVKYLTLIRAVTLLHQYQRPVRTVAHRGEALAYVEVTRDDIALANRLAHAVLGRSLDELPPQTRRLLGLLDAWVRERAKAQGVDPADVRFTRREVREATGWSDFPVRVHLARLVALEHVLVHHGGAGQRFVYELAAGSERAGEAPQLPGLLDPATLDGRAYDADLDGAEADLDGTVSPARWGVDGGSLAAPANGSAGDSAASAETASEEPESTSSVRSLAPSYPHATPSLAARAAAR